MGLRHLPLLLGGRSLAARAALAAIFVLSPCCEGQPRGAKCRPGCGAAACCAYNLPHRPSTAQEEEGGWGSGDDGGDGGDGGGGLFDAFRDFFGDE